MKLFHRLAALAVLFVALAAPSSSQVIQPPGSVRYEPGAQVTACVYYQTPLAAMSASAYASTSCDNVGNLYVALRSGNNVATVTVNAPHLATQNNGANALFTESLLCGVSNNGPQYTCARIEVGGGGGVTSANALLVATGGAFKTVLTSASPTTCTSIETVSTPNGGSTGRVVSLWSTGAASTATISIYDEGASPGCLAADLIWSGTFPVSTAPIPLNVPVTAGIAYTLSAALTSNAVITRN